MTSDTPPKGRSQPVPRGPNTQRSEETLSNAATGRATISICIPAFRDDASALLNSLASLKHAEACAILLYDDGTGDPVLTAHLADHILAYPGPAKLITATQNYGRSYARNRLVEIAETDWLLFLDADMLPDTSDFLATYLDAVAAAGSPALIVGGFSLDQVTVEPETRLHAAQALKSECLPAATRAKEAGRFVFSSNILVHKSIIEQIQFDPDYSGWGWEDVDWGLRVAEFHDIHHIDNTATHLGLDKTPALLAKYASSGQNFARTLHRHRASIEATRVFEAASLIAELPLKSSIRSSMRAIATAKWLPTPLRLIALKTYRAAVYAEHLS